MDHRLQFVPVDFEAGEDWKAELDRAGFDAAQPAVFASTGVSMYLTKEATAAAMQVVAKHRCQIGDHIGGYAISLVPEG